MDNKKWLSGKYFLPTKKIICKRMRDEHFIIDIEDSSLYRLNETAKRIWQLMNRKNKIEEITEAIFKEFNVVYATAEKEVRTFITDLNKKGYITVLESSPKNPNQR